MKAVTTGFDGIDTLWDHPLKAGVKTTDIYGYPHDTGAAARPAPEAAGSKRCTRPTGTHIWGG